MQDADYQPGADAEQDEEMEEEGEEEETTPVKVSSPLIFKIDRFLQRKTATKQTDNNEDASMDEDL